MRSEEGEEEEKKKLSSITALLIHVKNVIVEYANSRVKQIYTQLIEVRFKVRKVVSQG